MAKNKKDKGTVVAVKVKKPKTAAQQARAAANIKKAQRRFEQLQRQQSVINAYREQTGSLLPEAAILVEVRQQQDKAERQAEEQKARQFVESVLNGPHAEQVKRFIGRGLAGDACKIAFIIRNYLRTQGH
jgi:hypothetical protein